VIEDARDRLEHVIGWVAPTQDLNLPFFCKRRGTHLRRWHRLHWSSRMRLSFDYLRANWGQLAAPGAFLLELSRQAKQGRLIAKACGKHHAERQSRTVPCERHRHRRLSRHIEHAGPRHVAPKDRSDV